MAKPPRNRHQPIHHDEKLVITDGHVEILATFDPSDGYPYLPRNWADALAPINPKTGRPWHSEWHRHVLSDLTCSWINVPDPLLGRFTMNGDDNNNEMMKYYRTPAGDDFMAVRGRPKLAHHKTTPQPWLRGKNPDWHQLFGCMRRASLDIGIRMDSNFTLEGPRHILNHDFMGPHDPLNPFIFTLREKDPGDPKAKPVRYTPDDQPLVLRRHDPKESKLLLFEDDRASEGTSPHDTNTRLDEKFAKIKEVWERRLFEKKYGHKSSLLLFCTIGEERARNIRDYLNKRFGRMSYVLIKAFPEFRKLYKTIPVTTKAWDEPWIRPGYPDYSLKTLSEVS